MTKPGAKPRAKPPPPRSVLRAAAWRLAKPRACLRCARTFDSPHAGVRICHTCHRTDGFA